MFFGMPAYVYTHSRTLSLDKMRVSAWRLLLNRNDKLLFSGMTNKIKPCHQCCCPLHTETYSYRCKSSMISIEDTKSIKDMLVYAYYVIKYMHTTTWWEACLCVYLYVSMSSHYLAHTFISMLIKTDFHLQGRTYRVLLICFRLMYLLFLLYWRSTCVWFLFSILFLYFEQSAYMFIRVHLLYNFQRPQHEINVFLFLCMHSIVIWDDTRDLCYASK